MGQRSVVCIFICPMSFPPTVSLFPHPFLCLLSLFMSLRGFACKVSLGKTKKSIQVQLNLQWTDPPRLRVHMCAYVHIFRPACTSFAALSYVDFRATVTKSEPETTYHTKLGVSTHERVHANNVFLKQEGVRESFTIVFTGPRAHFSMHAQSHVCVSQHIVSEKSYEIPSTDFVFLPKKASTKQ